MQMRHQPRFLGDQAPQIVVDRGRIDRGQPQPRQLRHRQQQAADHLAKRRRARQVGAVGRDIDAGQHDFLIAAGDQRAHLIGDHADRHRAVGAAAERDDAERAAVVAALLHLHEGARAAGELGDQMRRGLARGHDVGHRGPGAGQPAFRLQLVVVAQHPIDVRQRGPGRGVDLRGAAGDDDARVGAVRGRAADRLARLALRLGGHGAGVDDDGVWSASVARRTAAHDLAFIGVQAAAEGEDIDGHSRNHRR